MFNKRNYKKVVMTVLALTMILGTVGLAANGIYTKQLTATYGKVRFNYEGSDVTSQIESKYGTPAFISGGRTYAPLKAIGDLLGVDIEWDAQTDTAYITDPKVKEYNKKLSDKDVEIAKLKKENEKLKEEKKKEEAKKEEEKANAMDLKSLEKDLNRKYSEYEKVKFDIVLKESKDKITIDINTDLGRTSDRQNWIRMRQIDKKYLIEDIVAQVRKDFKNVDIEGSIYDSSSRSNLYTFSQTKNGSLTISNRDHIGDRYDDRNDGYYGSIDSYVWDQFDKAYITGAKLTGKNRYYEISFADTSKNEETWYDLGESKIESMLDSIAKEIEYDNYYNEDYGRYDDYITIDIRMDGKNVGTYTKYYDENYGRFRY